MRNILEAVSLGVLGALWWITYLAVYGADSLPARIPTHFNAAGVANGWGPSQMLFLLPVAAVVLYLGFTTATRSPASFKFGAVRVTDENRPRLEALALRLIAWVKAEMIGLFLWVQLSILDAVRHPDQLFKPIQNLVPLCVAIPLATVVWHLIAVRLAARPQSPEAEM